ncbi:Ankyrin-1, partial [Bienertia sinuspersici]
MEVELKEVTWEGNMELLMAACAGDVQFLKDAIASRPNEDFLIQFKDPNPNKLEGNIFHLAVGHGKEEFIKEAMNLLPEKVKAALLSQQNAKNRNPLHMLCQDEHVRVHQTRDFSPKKMVLLILDFYRSLAIPDKPWLALDDENRTPLHWALDSGRIDDSCATEMLSMDLEAYCTMVDLQGNSLLYLACKSNYSRFATTILKSSYPYNVSGPCGSNALHAGPNSVTEEVIELLLKKDPELIDGVDSRGYNVLHSWVDTDRIISFNRKVISRIISAARAKVFGDFIHSTTLECRHNPLHLAALKYSSIKTVKYLIDGYVTYQKEINRGVMPMTPSLHPWTAKDTEGNMPVHIALTLNRYNEENALYLLSLDSSAWVVPNSKGDTPLFTAAYKGYGQVIEAFARIKHRPEYRHIPLGKDGVTILHCLSNYFSEEVVELLLEKNPELIDRVHEGGYNMLHKWAMTNSIPFYMNIIPRIIPAARGKFFGDFIHSTTLARRLNPLHLAAMTYSSSDAVQSLIDGYVAYQKEVNRGVIPTTPSVHPWTSKDWEGNMPVHLALEEMHRNEESVIYLLSVDSSLWLAPNSKGDTPLFTAAYKGYGQVIEAFARIKHRPEYRHIPLGKDGVTILHCLSNYFSEEVVELLLEKNPELIDRVHEGGYNMLHKWAMTNSIPFYMNIIPRIIPAARGKFFGDFIHSTTLARRLNPLHLAAMTYSSSDAVQSLIDGYVAYQKEVNRGVIPTTPSVHPWTSKDWEGNMPVHLALEEMHRNEESVIYLLSVDSSLWLAPNSKGDTPLFTAAYKGYGQVIEAFARIKHRPEYRHIPLGKDGVTILHCLSDYFS